MTVFIQLILAICPFQHIGSFTSLAIGDYMFLNAFVEIMKSELHAINKMARRKKCRKNTYKKLSEFIRRHANVKQLSGQLTLH